MVGWAAQNLEHRLLQLEASTSYLDQSTVESLKRLGARYFAYVYKQEGEWSVKWKRLGFLEKEEILEEVNEIDFNVIDIEKRTWHFNRNHELIYVTPVALAKSHQLYEGFLVFGLKAEFFKFIKSKESPVVLLTEKYKVLEGHFPSELEDKKEDMNRNEPGMVDIHVKKEGKSLIFISYFSPLSQLWVVHKRNLSSLSYFESLFFYYFLVITGFGCLLLLLFGGRLISFSLFRKKRDYQDQISVEEREINSGDFEETFEGETTPKEVSVDQASEVLDFSPEKQIDEFHWEESVLQSRNERSVNEQENQNKSYEEEFSVGKVQDSSVNPLFSPDSGSPKKEERSLSEIEKKVEEALDDFQLKKFDFEDSKIDNPLPDGSKNPDGSKTRQTKPEEIKTKLKADERGLFEFDNGQFKIKIRPPKKKDGNVNY